MKDDTLSRASRIRSRPAAAALADPPRQRVLRVFADRERSLAEAAPATGFDLKRLHYHVGALCRLGLLKVVRTQKRGGRPIKFYRTVARAFFVSHAMEVAPPHAALEIDLRASLDRLRNPALEGVLYAFGEGGELMMRAIRSAGPHDATAHTDRWMLLHLTRANALRLATEVDTLLHAFAGRQEPAAAPYLVRFAFAPNTAPPKRPRPAINSVEARKRTR